MALIQIKETAQFAQEISSHNVVIVDFYADWCGPCRAIAPMLEKLVLDADADENTKGKLALVKVNTDDQQALAKEHSVTALPTLLVFKGGVLQETVIGANFPRIKKAVTLLLGPPATSNAEADADADDDADADSDDDANEDAEEEVEAVA